MIVDIVFIESFDIEFDSLMKIMNTWHFMKQFFKQINPKEINLKIQQDTKCHILNQRFSSTHILKNKKQHFIFFPIYHYDPLYGSLSSPPPFSSAMVIFYHLGIYISNCFQFSLILSQYKKAFNYFKFCGWCWSKRGYVRGWILMIP